MMKITITNNADEVVGEIEVGQQEAAYLGHAIDPETFPLPSPETEPEPAYADEIVEEIGKACRAEILDESYGSTPYEDAETRPPWAAEAGTDTRRPA